MTKLTHQQIASLTGQALADAVAERVMGWTLKDGYLQGAPGPWWQMEADAARSGFVHHLGWKPHEFHNDAARVMDRIAELGLQEKFIRNLTSARSMRLISVTVLFDIANASPEARCRASLMAVEGER